MKERLPLMWSPDSFEAGDWTRGWPRQTFVRFSLSNKLDFFSLTLKLSSGNLATVAYLPGNTGGSLCRTAKVMKISILSTDCMTVARHWQTVTCHGKVWPGNGNVQWLWSTGNNQKNSQKTSDGWCFMYICWESWCCAAGVTLETVLSLAIVKTK